MKYLCVIPARGGSKGIPQKNIKPLCGKPLIGYSIDTARKLFKDEDICVSTDDVEIAALVEQHCKLSVPFIRPDYLATDNSGTYDVLLHALDFYRNRGVDYDVVVLLQPTSPFRSYKHVEEAIALYSCCIDMVVSVKKSEANPYYNLFEEKDGFLRLSKPDSEIKFIRRQDAPEVYEYNGAVYVINVTSLRKESLNQFKKVVKYVMSQEDSLDLDTPFDWQMAEFIMNNRIGLYDKII